MDIEQQLADLLHDAMCHICGAEPYHRNFYQQRARGLVKELEPIIGLGNVIPVMEAVMGELW